MMKKYKIGIVGAGPAGSLSAYFLQKAGHSVEVFERQSYPLVNKVCGEYLCPAGKDLLVQENLGFLVDRYPKIFGMKIHSPAQTLVDTQFPKKQFGFSLRRDQFDNDIIQLAQKTGVLFHFSKLIMNIKFNESEERPVTICTSEGEWSYDYLIGADGRQSMVAKWLGVTKSIHNKRVAIHTYMPSKHQTDSLAQGEMHIFKDGSYCGLNPVHVDYWNFSIVCDGQLLKNAESPLDIVQQKIKQSQRLSNLFTLPTEKNFKGKVVAHLSNSVSDIAVRDKRTFLVGDASGFVDPLTGEGIYHALLTAKLVSSSILESPSMKESFSNYKNKVNLLYQKKVIINYFFQWLIKQPRLCNFIANFLRPRKELRDVFVGLIGNVYTPLEAIVLMMKSLLKKKAERYVDHHRC